jgi:hypothetical protein
VWIIRILYPRESYDSWADPEGPIRTVCQSTTNVVVDAPASFLIQGVIRHESYTDPKEKKWYNGSEVAM